MLKKTIPEVFNLFKAEDTKDGRIAVLRQNYTPLLGKILALVYEPRIKFVPLEIPEFKPLPTPVGMYDSLYMVLDKVYLFLANHPKRPRDLDETKQRNLLIQHLETLDVQDAAVFIGVLKKDLEVPYLTVKLIEAAYPRFFEEEHVRTLNI